MTAEPSVLTKANYTPKFLQILYGLLMLILNEQNYTFLKYFSSSSYKHRKGIFILKSEAQEIRGTLTNTE